MPPKRCPNCKFIYFANPNTGDFIHSCNRAGVNPTLQQEDIVIIGDFSDYDGSGTKPPQQVMLAGVGNELSVSAQASMSDFNELTIRGNRETTHRSRSRLQYMKDPMHPGD